MATITVQPMLADLDLMPKDWRSAVKAAAVSIISVTVFIVAVDLLFGRHEQIAPLVPHLRHMIPRAAFEELTYRLVLMTLIVWAATWRTGSAPQWYFWGAIILSQFRRPTDHLRADRG